MCSIEFWSSDEVLEYLIQKGKTSYTQMQKEDQSAECIAEWGMYLAALESAKVHIENSMSAYKPERTRRS